MESKTADEQDNTAIAKAYFEALYTTRDYDRVLTFTADNMRFADSTAVGVEGALSDANRTEFVEYFRENMAHVDSQVDITKSFEGNGEVVLYLRYHGSMPDKHGKTVKFETEGITIIQVKNGKVTHHRDYVDYKSLSEPTDD